MAKHQEVDKPHYDDGEIPKYMGLHGDALIRAITVTATLGFLLFGYDQGVMSGIISAPQFGATFPAVLAEHYKDEGKPESYAKYQSSLIQATYTSIYEVGCLFGALFSLIYGDKLGRRKVMYLGAFVMCVGTLIQVTAFAGHKAPEQFCIGRVITGIGNGLNTSTIPTWQAETSKSHNRGLLVCIEASMIATGTVIAYWIDFGLSFVTGEKGDVSWRFPIALQIIFAVGLVTGVTFLPESPRWLLAHGYEEEGLRVVASLASVPTHSEEAQSQRRVIVDGLRAIQETQGAARRRDVFTHGKTQHFRRTLLGASSQIFQQIGGCNAVIYFAPVIFQDYLNQDRTLSLILGGVNVSVYALAAFGSYVLIEKVGRRKMFLWGSVGQAASMFICMGCLIPGTKSAYNGAVLGLFLFLVFFGATWLELPWLYPAEINPLRIRTNANAISTMSNWAWNFAVVQWTPPMLASLGWGTFCFFGVINACFVPIIWIWYPETAGRSLEEIDVIFALAYTEGKSYVSVSNHMPKLSTAEVESEAARLGLTNIGTKDLEHGRPADSPTSSVEQNAVDEPAPAPKAG